MNLFATAYNDKMTQKNNFDDAWEEIEKHIDERYTVNQNRKLY